MSEADGGSGPVTDADRDEVHARRTFVVLLVVAVPLFLARTRAQWFHGDEWAFLAQRTVSLDGLLDPHQEHLVALPALAYRFLWAVVGIRAYEPYQAMAIAVHLVVVVLLRAVLRRIGVGPWVATAAAAVLLFLGSGSENVWGFMVTFTGGLAFGLAQLLLADHDGPSGRRDVAAAACGVGAILCSGIGLLTLGVVGLALLLRRGPRRALLASGPSLLVYAAWRLTWGTDATDPTGDLGAIARFAADGLSTAVTSATQHPVVTVAAAILTLGGLGLVVASPQRSWAERRALLALPLAGAVGAAGFYASVARSRVDVFGPEYATRGRFLYVAVALLLPAVAVAADAVVSRWRVATVPVLLLVVAGVPGNVAAMAPVGSAATSPAVVLSVATSPDLADAPADLHPWGDRYALAPVSVGWLRAGVADRRVPTSHRSTPDQAAEASARLALVVGEPGAVDLPEPCPVLDREVRLEVSPDRPVVVQGVVVVEVAGDDGGRSVARSFGSFEPRTLASVGRPLAIVVRPDPGPYPDLLCR